MNTSRVYCAAVVNNVTAIDNENTLIVNMRSSIMGSSVCSSCATNANSDPPPTTMVAIVELADHPQSFALVTPNKTSPRPPASKKETDRDEPPRFSVAVVAQHSQSEDDAQGANRHVDQEEP